FRRAFLINARWPAAQNQPARRMPLNLLRRDVVPHNLAIDVILAYAAGNELGILGPKIEHQHTLVGNRISRCHIWQSINRKSRGSRATANRELYRRRNLLSMGVGDEAC